MAYPGDVRDHHRGADLRRDRRADAVRRLPGLPHALVARRLRAGRALGLGRRLAREARRARLRGRHRRPRQRGRAALVAALVLGPRKDYARQALLPHNVPFTLLGAGLLWFGWFGFNGGSALAANESAALAFVNTMLAPVATLVVWTLLDLSRTGRRPRSARDGDRRRPRRDHSGGRLRLPALGARCSARSRRSRATSRSLARADAPRRLARRRRRARPRRVRSARS